MLILQCICSSIKFYCFLMKKEEQFSGIAALRKGDDFFHPGMSVDCVVLGFHEGVIKILLNRYKGFKNWMLPGSFVFKDEDVDKAAYRILKERTGLENVFLRQFHLFGNASRKLVLKEENKNIFTESYGIDINEEHWFYKRFMTVGYYALVDFTQVRLNEGYEGETIEWFELNSNISYHFDHKDMVFKALETIRQHLSYIPVGRELLPDVFTMPELRSIYETLLGRPLDRRNFQKKMLSFGYFIKLNEKKKVGAHRSPILYRIDPVKYDLAQKSGIENYGW